MQKTCTSCSESFDVTPDDLAFYEKVSPVFNGKKYHIPPPTHCPACREQRRLAWRNERALYNRSCDLCRKDTVSIYPSDADFPVYCNKCWWSDKWDPMEYGREVVFSRPFCEQFMELHKNVPQLAIINDNGIQSDNCQYCQDFAFGKNCYLVIGSWRIEHSSYCRNCNHARYLTDCETVNIDSELVYESLDSQRLYLCAFLQNSENCSDCFLGFDLKGCKDCFACIGLRQKKFHIFNKPYSEEEYRKKRNSYRTDTHTGLEKIKKEFYEWIPRFPRKNMNLQNCEKCLGDHLFNCKNVLGFGTFNAENSKYIDRGDSPLWCYDIVQSGGLKWCLDCITPDDSYMTCFSLWCWKDKNILYSDNCHSSEHLFGCISLKRKKHCILNKQYSKEEYESLVPKLIEHMKEADEWGEFFPMKFSPFGYNETVAQEDYPLSKEQALAKGYRWRDQEDESPQVEKVIPAERLPDSIHDIPDDILNWAIKCEATGHPFQIIKQELAYYRKHKLPVPHFHPDERHRRRMALRNPRKLWKRTCDKCGKDVESTYAPDRPEIVYCEECYLKEVY